MKDGEKGAAAAAELAGALRWGDVASSGESQATAAAAVASSSAAVEGGGSTSIGAAVGGAVAVSGAAEAASTLGAGASPSQAERRGKAFIPAACSRASVESVRCLSPQRSPGWAPGARCALACVDTLVSTHPKLHGPVACICRNSCQSSVIDQFSTRRRIGEAVCRALSFRELLLLPESLLPPADAAMAETTTTCPWKDGAYGLGTHQTKKGARVTIRLATVEDVSEIRRLIVGLALYEKEPEETVEVTEDELRRDGFGAQPVFRCLLAEVDSVAIGFALFFYNYSTWQGRCIYLEDLYVEEAARGTGTGTLLLKTVAAIAHAEAVSACRGNL